MTQSADQLPDGRKPWGTRLIPGLFFLSLAILNTYPLAAAPGSFIGEHGDSYFSVWRLAWIAHQLWQRPGQLFNGNIFYPEKATLAYSDAILLPAIVVSPLHSLGVDPIVAYNLVLIAAFTLNGVAAYSLVRYLTGSMAAGLLGGAIFAGRGTRLALVFEHRKGRNGYSSRFDQRSAALACVLHGYYAFRLRAQSSRRRRRPPHLAAPKTNAPVTST